jgi:hypothetical protein
MAESAAAAAAPQDASTAAESSPAVEVGVAAVTAFDLDEPKKIDLRDKNAELSVKRPKDDELKKRDSTVKKCTSIIGRLKQVKDDWLDGRFLQELERVNLSKYGGCCSFTQCHCILSLPRFDLVFCHEWHRYMSEIATAIGELKLKAIEVWPTVQVVSQLHCAYAEFAPALVLQLKKVFEPAFSEAYPERRERLSRRRSTLRLLYVPSA